jgi:hypothetical protein
VPVVPPHVHAYYFQKTCTKPYKPDNIMVAAEIRSTWLAQLLIWLTPFMKGTEQRSRGERVQTLLMPGTVSANAENSLLPCASAKAKGKGKGKRQLSSSNNDHSIGINHRSSWSYKAHSIWAAVHSRTHLPCLPLLFPALIGTPSAVIMALRGPWLLLSLLMGGLPS